MGLPDDNSSIGPAAAVCYGFQKPLSPLMPAAAPSKKSIGVRMAARAARSSLETPGSRSRPVLSDGSVQQSPLRSRRWPRSGMPGLLGERCCARDPSCAKRRALRLQVPPGVPVPTRRATPSVRIEDNPCQSSQNQAKPWRSIVRRLRRRVVSYSTAVRSQ